MGMLKPRDGFVVPPLCAQNISDAKWSPRMWRGPFLASLVERYGLTHGAELGLWEGRTIDCLLASCPTLNMIGVDLWEPQPDNPGPEGYEGWDHGKHERVARKRCARFGTRATIIKARTVEAAALVPDGVLDFVFIDADHSEAGCRADIAAWLPKLKPSGWITGHDINWPGVRAAVDDLLPGYLIAPNVVWFRPVQPLDGWQREWL